MEIIGIVDRVQILKPRRRDDLQPQRLTTIEEFSSVYACFGGRMLQSGGGRANRRATWHSFRPGSDRKELAVVRVWTPLAEQVELIVEGKSWSMLRDAATGWHSSMRMLEPGQDYWFRLNGGEPLPDPRSPWQPLGINGPSRHIDHGEFSWTDRGWQARPLAEALIYELHIGTFTAAGTLEAAIDRLDHLVNLGVTHVEIMPVAEFPGQYGWGYDGVFPFAPHQGYGGPTGLKTLVNACHAKGLAAILDVVYNHLGPEGNRLPRFGPYFTHRHLTPWGDALNFDGPHSGEVRRYCCDNALMWLRDYHFDGLRLDAIHAIVDTSSDPFLAQLAREVDGFERRSGRQLVLIAESDLNDPKIVRRREQGGFGLDAQWSDDIHHALHAVLTGERQGYYADFAGLSDLANALTTPFVYAGRHSEFRQRPHGESAAGLAASKFVAYLQSHDQVGNRACGERIGHLVNSDRAQIGAALILLSPYVPLLFQGQEWGAKSPFQYFVDFAHHPELASAVADGRCREFAAFGWQPDDIPDPTAQETFQRSKLDWTEPAQAQHAQMLAWHQALIELRRRLSPVVDDPRDFVKTSCDERQQWLCMERPGALVVCNFSACDRTIPITAGRDYQIVLASKAPVELSDGVVKLPSESVAFFSILVGGD